MRRFFTLLLMTVATFALLPQHAAAQNIALPADTHNSAVTKTVQLLADQINQQRKQAGLPAVRISTKLSSIAQSYSNLSAQFGAISHTGPDGSTPGDRLTRGGYRWKRYGENLAMGFANPDELVSA